MAEIRIGLHLHPPPKQSLEAFTDMVLRADRYGFARLGTGDTQWHNMECFVALSLMALNSERAEIGPRVTNPVTREPSVMASAMVSLELISFKGESRSCYRQGGQRGSQYRAQASQRRGHTRLYHCRP